MCSSRFLLFIFTLDASEWLWFQRGISQQGPIGRWLHLRLSPPGRLELVILISFVYKPTVIIHYWYSVFPHICDLPSSRHLPKLLMEWPFGMLTVPPDGPPLVVLNLSTYSRNTAALEGIWSWRFKNEHQHMLAYIPATAPAYSWFCLQFYFASRAVT